MVAKSTLIQIWEAFEGDAGAAADVCLLTGMGEDVWVPGETNETVSTAGRFFCSIEPLSIATPARLERTEQESDRIRRNHCAVG